MHVRFTSVVIVGLPASAPTYRLYFHSSTQYARATGCHGQVINYEFKLHDLAPTAK